MGGAFIDRDRRRQETCPASRSESRKRSRKGQEGNGGSGSDGPVRARRLHAHVPIRERNTLRGQRVDQGIIGWGTGDGRIQNAGGGQRRSRTAAEDERCRYAC